jgi:hypothetical protein
MTNTGLALCVISPARMYENPPPPAMAILIIAGSATRCLMIAAEEGLLDEESLPDVI